MDIPITWQDENELLQTVDWAITDDVALQQYGLRHVWPYAAADEVTHARARYLRRVLEVNDRPRFAAELREHAQKAIATLSSRRKAEIAASGDEVAY